MLLGLKAIPISENQVYMVMQGVPAYMQLKTAVGAKGREMEHSAINFRETVIKVLDPHTAPEGERRALNDFDNRMQAEHFPGDPERDVAETINSLRFVPMYVDVHQWAAWTQDEREVIARGAVNILRTHDNQHVAEFEIAVLSEARRQGIAARLLRRIADVARREDRTLLLTNTDADIPAGRAFARRLGGKRGLVTRTSQLDLADLNLEMVNELSQRGSERARGFELGIWNGPYPGEYIQGMTAVKEVINAAPTGALEVEDFRWTAEQLRQVETSLDRQGIRRWTMYARHARSGEIAGFTEVFWKPGRPETLDQGDTAVLPRYRSRGLGTWLKVEMLQKIAQELPEAKRIRTNNAEANTAMLNINSKLGFKPYKRWTTWQVELGSVLKYLDERGN